MLRCMGWSSLRRREQVSRKLLLYGATMTEKTSFSLLLKRYRQTSGLSQEALAGRAGLSTRAISDLERAINLTPRYDTLERLTGALSLSAQQRALLLAAARPEVAIAADTLPVPSLVALPIPPSALIGREQECSRALTLLRGNQVRLLTVTGPSGVGKTRFALQLAQDLLADFPDGVAFVALAPIHDAGLVPEIIAQVLRLREQGGTPMTEQIREFLQHKRFLLVIDNIEHLLEVASFVAELLASCADLHVLVTSRTRLHLRTEHLFPLAPLAPPEAVTLFCERALATRPGEIYDETTVAAICEQVDRLPLAIELAAMYVNILALPQLLERLTTRLTLLQDDTRDLPPHQRTLRNAIAWSYELLTASQQRCFRALGVFLGGWTLDAAEVVCCREGLLAQDEVLMALAALIDHSLVSAESSTDGTSRFTMLETLREYALECLRAVGEEEQTRRQHADYYAELAKAAASPGLGQKFRDAELAQEFPNVRAGLRWSVERRAVVPGLQLAAYAGRLFLILGQNSEGYVWLERMLELDSQAGEDAAPVPVRLAALSGAGMLASNLGRTERAADLAQEELSLAERLGDHTSMSNALAILGNLAQARGDLANAADYFEQSYQHAQMGEDRGARGRALLNLASIARAQVDFSRARALLEERLEQNRAEKMTWGIANVLTMLGHIAREQQQYTLARSRYRESLPLYRMLGNLSYTAMCLEGIAALACAEGRYEQAACLCAHATALRLKAQSPLPKVEQKAFDNVVLMARSALGENVFAAAWGQGAVLTPEEGFALALSGIGETPEDES